MGKEIKKNKDLTATIEHIDVMFVAIGGVVTCVEFVMGGSRAEDKMILQAIDIYMDRRYGYISFMVRDSEGVAIFTSKDMKAFNALVSVYKKKFAEERSALTWRGFSLYKEKLAIIRKIINSR